jgi:GTP-binding protein
MKLRNIAIIAHVDHGKTTLVDKLLRQSQTLADREELQERAMDSNPQERERGITILAKNTAIRWNDYRINIVDTPGHADFGGEVERVLSMVDSVLLLVDAVDGPMPQTRFVTRKAFDHGLRPIVVINKVDRDGARPHWAVEKTFDLMDSLGASDEQLDFPIVYASALLGRAGYGPDELAADMQPLFETIVARCPPPDVDANGPLQLQVSALDYSSYVGAIGIGLVKRGKIMRNSPVVVVGADGAVRNEKVMQVYSFLGLKRIEVAEAEAGEIVCFAGLDHPRISDTLCDPAKPEALPPLTVDEPTIQMTFETNTSPFAGRDGKFVTSRQLRERIYREAVHNVALRVEDTDDPERFLVSGRGELHLSVFLETMRREGYEMAVSRPKVITRDNEDGVSEEPWELVTLDVETRHQGATMEQLGERGGELLEMLPDGAGRVRLDYRVPSRGLIGFQSDFRSMTSGTGLMHHVFDRYAPVKSGPARAADQRRADLERHGQGAGVRPVRVAGAGPAVHRARRRGLRGPGRGDPQPRERPDRESAPGEAAHQHPRRVEGREPGAQPGDPPHARAGARVHRRRRAGGDHACRRARAQALPQGARAQARGSDRRNRLIWK